MHYTVKGTSPKNHRKIKGGLNGRRIAFSEAAVHRLGLDMWDFDSPCRELYVRDSLKEAIALARVYNGWLLPGQSSYLFSPAKDTFQKAISLTGRLKVSQLSPPFLVTAITPLGREGSVLAVLLPTAIAVFLFTQVMPSYL